MLPAATAPTAPPPGKKQPPTEKEQRRQKHLLVTVEEEANLTSPSPEDTSTPHSPETARRKRHTGGKGHHREPYPTV